MSTHRNIRRTRRRFLAGVAATGVASLAGCSNPIPREEPPSEEDVTPTVPEKQLQEENWKLIDEGPVEETTTIERRGFSQEFTIKGRAFVYSDSNLRQRIKQGSLDFIDTPIRTFTTTKLHINPNIADLPGGVGSEQVLDATESQIHAQFKSRLTQNGLTNITRESDAELSVETGETARLTRYTATYPYDAIEFPITDEKTITFDGGELQFEALLALWERDGMLVIAGGGYPGENIKRTETVEVTWMIQNDFSVDTAFTPEEYEDDLRALMKQVS